MQLKTVLTLISILVFSFLVYCAQHNESTANTGFGAWINGGTGISIGLQLPGGAAGNDLIIGTFASGVWKEQMRITHGSRVIIAADSNLEFTGRSKINSVSDGVILLTNNAGTDFSGLRLGKNDLTHPQITPIPGANGITQGIKITRANGTNQVFAGLHAAAQNGAMIYCADCTIANPCAGGGTGAIAKRLNGVWVCN